MTGFAEGQVWFFLLALLAPLAWWRWMRRSARPAVTFSAASRLRATGGSLWSRIRGAVPLLRMLAILLVVVSLARPIKANEQTRVLVEGIAIELVVDRSGSMQALDFSRRGQEIDRLAAVKDVVTKFLRGEEGLAGRPNDMVGLVTFARFADSLSPPTLDHDHLITALRAIQPATGQGEDGTAIGEGVALAAEYLRDLGDAKGNAARRIKSRVVILLTDGENNAGDVEPMASAELCRTLGIRLYTIGVGSRGQARMPVQTPLGVMYQLMPVSIDEDLLRKMAEATGGQYFRATDSRSLLSIYEKIDQLEKTQTEQRRYLQYKDLAVESAELGGWRIPPLVLAAIILLALELLLSQTRLRTLP
ncbi:MAG: VWA domain-containing protein [Phycisphaerales bacterium]